MKKLSRTEYSLLNVATGIIGYGVNTVIGFVLSLIHI